MVIWLLEDIGYKNIASSFHPFLSMTTENWSLLLGVWHAFPLSFPSTTAVNAWVYPSFSQPQPCFLPLVCSRVVSAVTGFEKEESWDFDIWIWETTVLPTTQILTIIYEISGVCWRSKNILVEVFLLETKTVRTQRSSLSQSLSCLIFTTALESGCYSCRCFR